MEPLAAARLPAGVAARHVETATGLAMHVLEAGAGADRPLALLLHGFPELAYSWRRIIPALAEAGFHVVAPDQRGYGRTIGGERGFDVDLTPFSLPSLVRDALALLAALGRDRAAAVIGHDFGSPVAAWCALIRPDVFRACVMMSAPIGGPPGWEAPAAADDVDAALAALKRPRKHYQRYYSGRAAAPDMDAPPQGLHAFLRAYFHAKSGDWAGNDPRPLGAWTADALAVLPDYYVMALADTMPQAVAPMMPDAAAVAACRWLPDEELSVFVEEFGRTGFQPALNWYRCGTSRRFADELRLWAGRRIEPPSAFIGGARDWGVRQKPGELERMQSEGCADFRALRLVPGAGHWVQQEAPREVAAALTGFLRAV